MMRSWIHFTRGRFVRQARVGLGDLREEHLSRHGFAGPVAMLYRTDGPNEVVRIEGDYRPRQIDSAAMARSMAASLMHPVAETPSPRRMMREKESTTRKLSPNGQAISSRQLLVPRSSAA